MSGPERVLTALGAVAGGLGVALAAAAAHTAAGTALDTSARFLLVHAPALIGVAAALRLGLLHWRTGILGGASLALGLALFSGDLAWRALAGWSPAPMAAPAGGVLLIAGWSLLAAAAVIGPARAS